VCHENDASFIEPTLQGQCKGERIAALEYDAANDEWTRTDYYYNASWQVIEERRVTGVADYEDIDDEAATAVYCQYVWDAQYIDTPVCRMRDANGFAPSGSPDGTLEETMYYLTDANHNVTALLDGSRDGSGAFGPRAGQVVERYVYDP
jgi:hypothetical protein